jgi:glutathione peroxidase-family protein
LAEKNYTQLVQLHREFSETRGLRILAFPCNQFANQEPGTEEEIKQYAAGYGVEFDMFSKINVNGSNAHPLYKYLKKKQTGNLGSFIKWNYTKFLCDRNGIPVKRYGPNTSPLDIVGDMLPLFQ